MGRTHETPQRERESNLRSGLNGKPRNCDLAKMPFATWFTAAISCFCFSLDILHPWYSAMFWGRVSQLFQHTLLSSSLFYSLWLPDPGVLGLQSCLGSLRTAFGKLAGFGDCPVNYGCFVNMVSQIILRWLQLASAFLPSTPATHSGSQLHPLSCLPSLK